MHKPEPEPEPIPEWTCSISHNAPFRTEMYIPKCSIQNRNVYISVLNGALWDMEQVYSGISELGQLRDCRSTECTTQKQYQDTAEVHVAMVTSGNGKKITMTSWHGNALHITDPLWEESVVFCIVSMSCLTNSPDLVFWNAWRSYDIIVMPCLPLNSAIKSNQAQRPQ